MTRFRATPAKADCPVASAMKLAFLATTLAAPIASLSSMTEDRPTCDGAVLQLPIRHRRGGIAEAVRRLDQAGVGIADIAVRRPTLDDVFIALTGHAAEPEAEDEETVEEEAA